MRNKSEKRPPNPGSPEAQAAGCVCPIIDNSYGKGRGGRGDTWGWYVSGDCLMHNEEDEATEVTTCNAVQGTVDCVKRVPARYAFADGWRTVEGEYWCTNCLKRYGFVIDEEQPGVET